MVEPGVEKVHAVEDNCCDAEHHDGYRTTDPQDEGTEKPESPDDDHFFLVHGSPPAGSR
jgi:hypothetical protein